MIPIFLGVVAGSLLFSYYTSFQYINEKPNPCQEVPLDIHDREKAYKADLDLKALVERKSVVLEPLDTKNSSEDMLFVFPIPVPILLSYDADHVGSFYKRIGEGLLNFLKPKGCAEEEKSAKKSE